MHVCNSVLAAALLFLAASWPGGGNRAEARPVAVHAAVSPNFTLPGTDGHSHSLRGYRGRPVVLFFFCGCEWCHRCAHIWSQMQQAGALEYEGAKPDAQPVTVVVFQGDAGEARQFAKETGLSPQTVLLTDPTLQVTLNLYHAEICPRVFVLNRRGEIVYTNDHKDDSPRKAPEMTIATRALKSLLSLSASAQN